MNGLQLLEFLNPDQIGFDIIFTTASDEHAVRAFEMSAIDYVLKPIQYEKLKFAIDKFILNKVKKSDYLYGTLKDNYFKVGIQKIVVPISNGYEIVKLDEINYIQAEGSYVKIFLNNRTTLLVSNNLKYFEEMLLDNSNYLRIHRSHLVNIQYIRRITRNDGTFVVMEDDTLLAVSSDKVDVLLKFLNFQKK